MDNALMDNSEESRLKGQAQIWEHMFAFVDSMALRCAIELGIPDIINSHGRPVTMPEIIGSLKTTSSSPVNANYLTRIMRLLVHKHLFTSLFHRESNDTVNGLTRSSKWLLKDSKFNLSPMFLLLLHPLMLEPWQYLGNCLEESGLAFVKANGREIWDLALANPQFNQLFNDGMGCTAKMIVSKILVEYKDGFNGIGSLVDVGGGTGGMIAEIVESNPHIQGINFDLPHVLANAPERPGVTHVRGDMFINIPEADAVITKWIMHDWSDENCIEILRNCYKAISKTRNGKVIIVDCVLVPDRNDLFDKTRLVFDLLMMVIPGGKERTEAEWKMLLKSAGFCRYNVIKIPTIPSIIEAFPK
ncbi:hypothetical protein C5167_001519 [Papaver somniferum]|uniref:Uncharacterized protein n=1 Tax=Papaver somniferum TaxID=3469 RepID=A0A4Y7KY58_PAPSO|nr:(R,S)-reticuline 7-O-methyltransferase-like [Papaver somniferum]RZC77320.1 hypothetical protein C5167_001519 [Papaver somniferum]